MAPVPCVAEDGFCWAPKVGEALGPVKARCPSVGDCQGGEEGRNRWGSQGALS